MNVIRLNHLDSGVPPNQKFHNDYNFVWNLVDSILGADPSIEVRLLISNGCACSRHIYHTFRFYSDYGNKDKFLIRLEPFLDNHDTERVEIVITKNEEVIE
jgi:hypothetical protein